MIFSRSIANRPQVGQAIDLRFADAALRRLQDVEGGGDFRHRIAEQADADRVADAVEQDRRQSRRRFRDRIGRLARFGDADVRRIIAKLREEAIGFHCGRHVARFQRHDHVVVAFRLGDFDVANGAFDHRGRAGESVLLDQFALQAAGVDADAHRHAALFRLADHLAEAVVAADIAGIDANFVDRMIEGRQRHLVIEMDVADERDADLLADLGQGGGVFRLGHGDADQFAAGLFEALDLCHGRRDVEGVGRRHRLDANRIVAADGQVADHDLARLMTGLGRVARGDLEKGKISGNARHELDPVLC